MKGTEPGCISGVWQSHDLVAAGLIKSINKINLFPLESGAKLLAEIGVVAPCVTQDTGFLLILYLTPHEMPGVIKMQD